VLLTVFLPEGWGSLGFSDGGPTAMVDSNVVVGDCINAAGDYLLLSRAQASLNAVAVKCVLFCQTGSAVRVPQ